MTVLVGDRDLVTSCKLNSDSVLSVEFCLEYVEISTNGVNWRDWENDWVFYDSRFNLLHAPDEEFLRFLCETVHPVVRPDIEEALALVEAYNKELAAGTTFA